MKEVRLGEVCDMSSGGTPRRGTAEYYDGDIPWAKIGDLEVSGDGLVTDTEEKITKEGLNAIRNRLFEEGTLLLAMYGSVGKTAFAGTQMSANQAILGITPKNGAIDLKYLRYWFVANQDKLVHGARGVALKNISATIVKNTKVPLPPLETQQKIAAILDAADAYRQKTKALIAKYDQLAQSLFLDMFGNVVRNEKKWNELPLGEISNSRLGKMLDKKQQTGTENRKYLRNTNVQWEHIDTTDLHEMDFFPHDREEFRLRKGDVLVCEGGEVGRAAVWNNEMDECYFQKALHRIRVKEDTLDGNYLVWWLKETSRINGFKDYVSSVTIAHLTGEKLKSMRVALPPIELQREFSRKLENIKLQKGQVIEGIDKSEDLFNSLLQRAFKGELV